MEESTLRFYDELADEYHLISTDWRESVLRQASLLDNLIRAETRARDVLDCACGIGTQAIGLALRGYTVHATDLSPLAIKRAKREAASFGVSIKFGVADFRSLHADVAGEYDVVIACDNALPHLLGDEDLRFAAGEYTRLRPHY